MHVGFLRSRPPDTPHRISRDGIPWERGRPARIRSLWPPLSFRAMLQAATLSAETSSARQSPGAALLQVGEMAVAVPGFVRAGRPRSQEASIP